MSAKHLKFLSCRSNNFLQNLSDNEIDAVLVAYEPLDENGDDKGRIAISDVYGDVSFACPIERVARVSEVHCRKQTEICDVLHVQNNALKIYKHPTFCNVPYHF